MNQTGYQIDRVYISPTTAQQWGSDAMPQAKLDDGQRVSISLPACRQQCQWDLRVEYHDGQRATWSGLNLLDISKMSLFWNTKTRMTIAQAN